MISCRKSWWIYNWNKQKHAQNYLNEIRRFFQLSSYSMNLGKSINQHPQIHPGPWAMIPKWSIWEQRLLHWFIVLDAIEIFTGRPPTSWFITTYVTTSVYIHIYIYIYSCTILSSCYSHKTTNHDFGHGQNGWFLRSLFWPGPREATLSHLTHPPFSDLVTLYPTDTYIKWRFLNPNLPKSWIFKLKTNPFPTAHPCPVVV